MQLEEARRFYDRQAERLNSAVVTPEATDNNLKDLETTHRDIVAEFREVLDKYGMIRKSMLDALASGGRF